MHRLRTHAAPSLRRRFVVRPQALGRGLGTDLGKKFSQALKGGDKPKEAEPSAAREASAEAAARGDAATHADADAAPAAATAAAAAAAPAATVTAPEALRQAGKAAAARARAVEYEEVEEEVPVKGVAEYAADAKGFLTAPATAKGLGFGAVAFLGATFAMAVLRVHQRNNTAEAQRRRMVDRNKQLVQGLSELLPDKRSQLTPDAAKRLQRASGFTTVEVFRKFLWYVLRERKFDPDAVSDMVALKGALGLGDEDVAEALRERAQRIYDKYGTLMLSTEGMSSAGLQRKATCQALFSKMLYLTEHEPLVAQGSDAFKTTDLRMIFGATDEDTERLRIPSLVEMDAERLERLMAGDAAAAYPADSGGGGATSSGAAPA